MRNLFGLIALVACGIAHASTCYVTEFQDRPPVTYQAALVPALVDQTITYTTSSVASAAFNFKTALVRVVCDAPAWVSFGTTPAATLGSMKLATNVPEYFTITVNPQASTKVAVIGQ